LDIVRRMVMQSGHLIEIDAFLYCRCEQGCTATDVGRQLHADDGSELQHAADGATSPGVAAPWSADRRSTPGPGTSKESSAPPLPPRPRLGNANPLDALLNELQSFNQSRKQVHR